MRERVFPVRWAPDTYGGRGSPFFNFYAPLFYYLAEIPHLAGLSVLWSVKIAIALVFIVSGTSMFLLVRRLAGERAGLFAAVFYMYSPYFLFDVYIRGSLGEALGIAILPLILLAFHMRSPLLGGAAYAALVLSHNSLALISTPFLALYALYLCFKKEMSYKEASLVFALGLGLSAFFWAPAISEMDSAKIDWVLIFDYRGAFRELTDVVSPLGHFTRATTENMTSLQVGMLNLLFALLAYPLVRTPHTRWILSLLALSIFMVTPYSAPLWSILPFGQYVQFPWRVFALSALYSSMLSGVAFGALSARLHERWSPALALLIILSSMNFIGYSTKITIDDEAVNAAKLREYYDVGLTYGHEYLPRDATLPTGRVLNKVEVRNGDAKIQEVKEGCASLEFKASGSGDVKINTNWFPGWVAQVDGLPTPLLRGADGSMIIHLAEGFHAVAIKFENTLIRKISNAFSFISLIAIAILRREWRKSVEGQ